MSNKNSSTSHSTSFNSRMGNLSSIRFSSFGNGTMTHKIGNTFDGVTDRIGNFTSRFGKSGQCISFGSKPDSNSRKTYFNIGGISNKISSF